MSRRAKIITLITTVAVLLVAFFSYQSYTHISVKDSEPSVSKKAKPVQNVKANNKKKAQKKDDNSIFLQDTNSPDRIIAIHPNGSKGIYQYRKQANGTIYPEFKFFNGDAKYSNGNLFVNPNAKNQSESFNFKTDKSGNYVETNSKRKYQEINTSSQQSKNQENSSTPSSTTAKAKYNGFVAPGAKYAVINDVSRLSDPSNDGQNPTYLVAKANYVRIGNGDFVNFYDRDYYGDKINTFNTNTDVYDVFRNPSNVNKVMFWENNGVRDLSPDELNETTYFNQAMRAGHYNY
ncbi:hypothetical protein [Companilactobacillus ginsenosidimutans]|uniref:Uncharacterized protein n=1 Tax=Companilactobacillus ginsenosidimutans TaxID=1007676 RepID=A0A0H4QLE1_9LACO|nr:hypothetical protein [Companilactobacillus ginsenosidimutans]AKP67896.1 hypothetical protein ABM34_10385 [Companilactobacillus ginsenosidimutans]